MAGIEQFGMNVPQVEPTICGPVSDFKELTLSSNAIALGNYGFIAGVIATCLAGFAYFYVAPRAVAYGRAKGWWS